MLRLASAGERVGRVIDMVVDKLDLVSEFVFQKGERWEDGRFWTVATRTLLRRVDLG